MFQIYDRYILRQLMLATLIVAGGLSMIILLTQSLKLIELVLESNASAQSFLIMMALSLPRFFESVLPAAVLIATLFVFHRLAMDSELVVLRAAGTSPLRLARPVLTGTGLLIAGLLVLSLWVSPIGIAKVQNLRKEIRAQYAHLMFREGIFNTVGPNLTAYVNKRAPDGRLVGLMVHDTRTVANGGPAVTIVARSGNIVTEKKGQKIIVYDGSRQELNPRTDKFSRLDFSQYTLDMPDETGTIDERWREPDERTLGQLIGPVSLADSSPDDRLQFRAELNRRFSTPVLMLAFALMSATALLLGPFRRGGQMPLIGAAAVFALTLQGAYLVCFSLAKKTLLGCVLMYVVAGLPVLIALFFLTPPGERIIAQAARLWHRLLHHDLPRRRDV
ncbi:MAG: LptF/LptG family permease [Rhodospirillales bacterium]|nr:LptF/LptG family permease [Alphaproteobacteria bacterium]MCB9986760.1 LptF/LptG family permease [Rhodospirillales bacterium]USO08469.1 MAG: LptF/LptG family permease [Rhodospirillales bacterium]